MKEDIEDLTGFNIYCYIALFEFPYCFELKGFIIDDLHIAYPEGQSIYVINIIEPNKNKTYEIPNSVYESYYCEFTNKWLPDILIDEYDKKFNSFMTIPPKGLIIDLPIYFEALMYEKREGHKFVATEGIAVEYIGIKLIAKVDKFKFELNVDLREETVN